MYPILYESGTVGNVAQHNGLGILSDCISCTIEQERNGKYELTMEYPKNGIHAGEIATRRLIKARPNATDNAQLFRIDRIGKTMNGVFTVYGKHHSYDLSGYEITEGTAGTIQEACLLLQQAAAGWTITTDKTNSGNFKIDTPASVRSYFGGKKGSILDLYGGELKYDNYTVQFLNHAGQDRGVTIRYGKNLLELSQETASDNLYTHVLYFYKSEETDEMIIGTKVATGLTLDTERCLILDASSDYEETPTTAQLTAKATEYIGNHNLTIPSDNITLDFVQSEELSNRVDLCDTVSIYYEALGITRTSAKCIRTKWDVIREKYIETEFGDAKTTLADTIVETNRAITEKPTATSMERAIRNATQLITGNLGGFVVIHDSNEDGEPDEILIMDQPTIDQSLKIWRWNKNGLGYSSTGYDGTYGLAVTSDGAIVANFITTGTMSGDRIRTGLIASQNNQLLMNLDTGTITAPAITLNGEDVGDKLAELEQVSVVTNYALSNSGTNIPASFPLNAPTEPTEWQPYLWSRTIYTYADGQENTSYAISVRGAKGADGADGRGLSILGNYDTMEDLIADHPTGSAGDAYMVGTDLVVWNTSTNSWENVGRIQGPSGFDGLWLAIENNDTGANTNITYTAKLFKGVTDVTATYNAVFAWQMVKESGITQIATGTPTVTVARDAADYGGTIRCICVAILTDEALQDYGYNTITDYTGNDIQIIGSNAVRLTGDAALYKPYAIESQFQVLQDEISSRVTQTEFNSLTNTVSTQGTQIQQNAQAITLKANQSTVNTLSNTVSSQGTAIQQNAQAITLKADTSTVNNQMSGKMATDMSNRSSSITINSGEIKFESNTVSISATNLTVTKTGLVSAVKFTARDEFSLQDASGNRRGYFKYPTTGTHFALLDSNAREVAELWDNNGSGRFWLKNSSQAQTIFCDGSTGDITATGKISGNLFGPITCDGLTAKTQIIAADNSNNTRVFFNAGTYGYGAFKNSSGDNNIYLRGDTGNIECVSVTQTSSRKMKENIKPIEDAEKILKLQAVSFDYKDKERGTDKRGFIAEDVAEILPNLVREETEEKPASLDYIGMIPYLQDLTKRQEKRITELEARIERLEKMIQSNKGE